MREVGVKREAPGLEALARDRPEERHGIEIVKPRLEPGEDTRDGADADLRQRLAGESLHDQEGSAEKRHVGGREKNAWRRVAEVGERVLGRPLTQRARGVVMRVEQPENQRTGEGRQRRGQAEGEDLRVEAPRQTDRALGELQMPLAERCPQMVAKPCLELCHPGVRRQRPTPAVSSTFASSRKCGMTSSAKSCIISSVCSWLGPVIPEQRIPAWSSSENTRSLSRTVAGLP